MYAVSLKLGEQMRSASKSRLSQHEVMALGIVNRMPGIRQSDLARALSLSPVQMSRLAADLEGRHLVERRPHRHDLRSKMLHPTESGREAYSRMRKRSVELAKEVFRELPDEALRVLVEQTSVINRRLGLGPLSGHPDDEGTR